MVTLIGQVQPGLKRKTGGQDGGRGAEPSFSLCQGRNPSQISGVNGRGQRNYTKKGGGCFCRNPLPSCRQIARKHPSSKTFCKPFNISRDLPGNVLVYCSHCSSEQEKPDWGQLEAAVLDSAHCHSDSVWDAGCLGLFSPLALLCPAGENPRCPVPAPAGSSPAGAGMALSHCPTEQATSASTRKNPWICFLPFFLFWF